MTQTLEREEDDNRPDRRAVLHTLAAEQGRTDSFLDDFLRLRASYDEGIMDADLYEAFKKALVKDYEEKRCRN